MRATVEKPQPRGIVKFMYYNRLGAPLLRLLSGRGLSKFVGSYMDSRASKHRIKKYIKNNGIDMTDFIEREYRSFNDFFTRDVKAGKREFSTDPADLCSPCDGKLSAYNIHDLTFNVKGFDYTVGSLLKNERLASEYEGGLCLVFRLAVTDYHRYRFFDSGSAHGNTFIKGRLHTVRPQALARRRVFTENCREYTVLDTQNFGQAVQVEVGAMMVGRIVNTVKCGEFSRGEQKGYFEFGGSTVILLLKPNTATIDEEFFTNTALDLETVVKCGETIGKSTKTIG